MTRRHSLLAVGALLVATATGLGAQAQKKPAAAAAVKTVKVHLRPTCGCCGKWVEHLEAAGFKVTRNVTADLESVPERKGVPAQLQTCHTAIIGPYLVEGHVPVDVIQKLLKEQPKIAGIAVPGMPIGSPGMEGPSPRPYSIVAFKADGSTYEFARR